MIPLAPIPEHTNCQNCGECCGPLPLDDKELSAIADYVSQHKDAQAVAAQRKNDPLTCIYRDEQKHRCAVYPVRPLICRLMGVSKGMQCPHGNSAAINGQAYLAGYKADIICNLHNPNRVTITRKEIIR